MIRTTLLVLTFAVCLGLHAEETSPVQLEWQSFRIFSTGSDDRHLLVFQKKKDPGPLLRLQAWDYGHQRIMNVAPMRGTSGELLYAQTFDRGESGGSITLTFFKASGDAVQPLPFEIARSGYNAPEVQSGSGPSRILIPCEAFYGKRVGTLSLTGVYVSGHGLSMIPRIAVMDQAQGKVNLKDVTFSTGVRNVLNGFLVQSEKALGEQSGKTWEGAEGLQLAAGLATYYYFKIKLGEEADALAKITRAGIKILDSDQEKSSPAIHAADWLKTSRADIVRFGDAEKLAE